MIEQARTATIALFVPILGAWASPASACDCVTLSLEERYEQSNAVFVGEVTSYRPLESVELKVIEGLKGLLLPSVTIAIGPSDCDYFVAPIAPRSGEQFLVFAIRRGDALIASRCLGSGPANESSADLATLRSSHPRHDRKTGLLPLFLALLVGGNLCLVIARVLTRQTWRREIPIDGPGRNAVHVLVRPADFVTGQHLPTIRWLNAIGLLLLAGALVVVLHDIVHALRRQKSDPGPSIDGANSMGSTMTPVVSLAVERKARLDDPVCVIDSQGIGSSPQRDPRACFDEVA